MKQQEIHLLLVDDDKDHVKLIRHAFQSEKRPIRFSVAENLHEARSLIAASSPDIAIIDYLLPDGSGLEIFSEKVREIPFPIIIMTSYGDEALAVKAMQSGAFDYIKKSEASFRNMPDACKKVLRKWDHLLREKAAERALHESEERFRAVFNNATEGMSITDASANILTVNPAFTEITGYSAEEVIGKNPRILQSGRHDKSFYQAMWQSLNTSGHWEGEVWNRHKSGEIYAESLSITAVKDAKGDIINFTGLFRDITQRKQDENRLHFQAHYDPLTWLPNRMLFFERLSQATKQARRNKTKAALLFVDLDFFKDVNDTLGHLAGDKILRRVAKRMLRCVREVDTVARAGGDEFLVVLSDIAEKKEAALVADKMIETISRSFRLEGHSVLIGASIGIVIIPDDGDELVDLLGSADRAMYKAKQSGRNRFHFFTGETGNTGKVQTDLK